MGYDIDFCLTEDFKEQCSKYPLVNLIYYPNEVLTSFRAFIALQKEMANTTDDRLFDAKCAFEIISFPLCRIIVPWALKTLNAKDIVRDLFIVLALEQCLGSALEIAANQFDCLF